MYIVLDYRICIVQSMKKRAAELRARGQSQVSKTARPGAVPTDQATHLLIAGATGNFRVTMSSCPTLKSKPNPVTIRFPKGSTTEPVVVNSENPLEPWKVQIMVPAGFSFVTV